MRTGYYLPDHPQAHKAKQGLHGHFQSRFQGRHELTFMVQDLGETKDILVEGALPETQRLKGLMAAGMAEVYVPRLSQFLERKDLVSLTLKEGMAEEEFSRWSARWSGCRWTMKAARSRPVEGQHLRS